MKKSNLFKKKTMLLSTLALLTGLTSGCNYSDSNYYSDDSNYFSEDSKSYAVIKNDENVIIIEIEKTFISNKFHHGIYFGGDNAFDVYNNPNLFYFAGTEEEAYIFAELFLGKDGEIKKYDESGLSLKK